MACLLESFRFTSAGHPRGCILDAAHNVKGVLESSALPLGIDANTTCTSSAAITLEPGDLVLPLTDGIVETCGPRGESAIRK